MYCSDAVRWYCNLHSVMPTSLKISLYRVSFYNTTDHDHEVNELEHNFIGSTFSSLTSFAIKDLMTQ